ncbi:MAG: ABC transporter permease [Dongiaceae bacterium]
MPDAFARWAGGLRRAATLLGVGVLAFLYLPILTLIVYSFSVGRSFTVPIQGLTLAWYAKLAGNDELLHAIGNSLIVGAGTVPLSLLLGVPAAYALARFRHPALRLAEPVLQLPLMIPGLITGLSVLLLLKRLGFGLSLGAVVLGHTVAWLPIVVTQVFARLRRLDRRIEEASLDLGAGPLRTFARIVLPNIRGAVIGSGLLVFTLSFDEVAITFMLTATENTLPMQIWAMLRQGVTPEICAVATLTVVVSAVLATLGLRLQQDRR